MGVVGERKGRDNHREAVGESGVGGVGGVGGGTVDPL